MIMTDYHAHTNFSIDSPATMKDMVEGAVIKGIKELVFTDHQDFASASHLMLGYTHEDYLAYGAAIKKLNEIYKDKITIKWGVEIGMNVEYPQEINQFLQSYPFEFVIGSIHDIDRQEIYIGDYFNGKSKQESYEDYFTALYNSIQVCDFDVIGHFDYVPRYVSYDDINLEYRDYKVIIDRILIYIIQNGRGIELNTSGHAYQVKKHHPQLSILKAYKDLGGEIITVGSDAHQPAHVARHFDEARDMLLSVGFTHYTRFNNRMPYFEKL